MQIVNFFKWLRAKLPSLTPLWNRGLPAHVDISHNVIWPLFLLPIALFNQLVTPHPVWVVLVVSLACLYGVALFWVRNQAPTVTLQRRRLGALLVAGDALREEFELRNESIFPVIWAELLDGSDLPNYNPGRVVACSASSTYRWNSQAECKRRGVYRLGPYQLALADPFGLFTLTLDFPESETILIYPRVARLPVIELPEGNASGTARRRRPLLGVLPSASVRSYQATDSLRYVHWPITAHRGELMVKELETEPSGAVWIVLDLNGAVHSGVEEADTLEFAIVVAASLTAQILGSSERRTVGLLTITGQRTDHFATLVDGEVAEPPQASPQAIVIPPQTGQAQMWRVLAALASVQASPVGLAELLRSGRESFGRYGTLIVITPQPVNPQAQLDWPAELVHLQTTGLGSSVLLVTPEVGAGATETTLPGVLARYNIPLHLFPVDVRLPSALTFRRTRKVIRSTPTGGVVSYEVEEEVG